MKTSRDKASYCIGLEAGRNLRSQFKDIDLQFVLEGVQDAFSSSEPKLPQKEMNAIVLALRQTIETQQKEYIKQLSEQNRSEGEAYLAENKNKEGIVCLPSGLQY